MELNNGKMTSGIRVSSEMQQKMAKGAELVSEVAEFVQEFADKAGYTKTGNPDPNAARLNERAKEIRNETFRILVCGKFKNGKSTIINALLGGEIMAAKATPCTAVITTVSKGNSNEVKVVYRDGHIVTMPLDEYTKEFQLTKEENERIDLAAELGEEIVFDRFADVDHAEIESNHPMFESGATIIDAPGLEEAIARERTTKEYLLKAHAIVYTLNATQLFSAQEQVFINEHFVGKHLRNVFFIINRVNNLKRGELEGEIIPRVRSGLASCFTDENGKFDEELFKKRVFYVNAYGALCARKGVPVEIDTGNGYIEVLPDITKTGIPDYEKAQNDFIASGDRFNAKLTSALDVIATAMKSVARDKAEKVKSMGMDADRLQQARSIAEQEMKNAEETVSRIASAFKKFANLASEKVYNNLIEYFDRSIIGEYPSHVKKTIKARDHFKVSWQLIDTVLGFFAWIPSLQAIINSVGKKHMKPIIDDFKSYLSLKMKDWEKHSTACIQPDIEDLSNELHGLCEEFDIQISAAYAPFDDESVNGTHSKTTTGNIQSALALILSNDVDTLVEINNRGEISWGRLAHKIVSQTIIDIGLTSINPYVALLRFAIDAALIVIRADKAAQGRARQIGGNALNSYRDALVQDMPMAKKKFNDEVVANLDRVSAAAREVLKIQSDKVANLTSEQTQSVEEAKALEEDMDRIENNIRAKMVELFNHIYGRVPTEAELQSYGLK